MQEIYKDIPNYEGYYQVSNVGNVRSLERVSWNGKGYHTLQEKILKPYKSSNGYYIRVSLNKDGIRRVKEDSPISCYWFFRPYPLWI